MPNLAQITADNWAALIAATRHQVRVCGGNEACASISQRIKRHQTFSDYYNPNQASMMPIDVVAELMRESGDVRIVQTLARMVGHEVVALPQLPARFADLQMALGRTSKEVGEVFTRIGESLSDGTFDKGERQATINEIDEAIGALVALKQVVGEGE
ncbi:phage regulatory CII family protein [Maritalea sp.]|jgi:hypothetical protein|uniref:phage regulatory CII family protein n=1 Tax=Maritalea sp. TaxID=2003361 RepID=UPI0039E4F200